LSALFGVIHFLKLVDRDVGRRWRAGSRHAPKTNLTAAILKRLLLALFFTSITYEANDTADDQNKCGDLVIVQFLP
jgi:hypothetical protein